MNAVDEPVIEALKGLQTFHAWLEDGPDDNDQERDPREFAETQSMSVLIQSTAANRMQRRLFELSETRSEIFDLCVCIQKIYMTLRIAVDLSQRFLTEERFADAGSVCVTKKTVAREQFGKDFFHMLAVCCLKLKMEKSDGYLMIAIDYPGVSRGDVTAYLTELQFRLFRPLFEAMAAGLSLEEVYDATGYKKTEYDTLRQLKNTTNRKLKDLDLKIYCQGGRWMLKQLENGQLEDDTPISS